MGRRRDAMSEQIVDFAWAISIDLLSSGPSLYEEICERLQPSSDKIARLAVVYSIEYYGVDTFKAEHLDFPDRERYFYFVENDGGSETVPILPLPSISLDEPSVG